MDQGSSGSRTLNSVRRSGSLDTEIAPPCFSTIQRAIDRPSFTEATGRWMSERDYAAWVAVRAVSEASTRGRTGAFAAIADYIRSDRFGVAGFKGLALTFRDWDGQLRQPILLAEARTLVSVSPQEGFLHQSNELDTLGVDRPETECRMP